jgi:hypothetical protein
LRQEWFESYRWHGQFYQYCKIIIAIPYAIYDPKKPNNGTNIKRLIHLLFQPKVTIFLNSNHNYVFKSDGPMYQQFMINFTISKAKGIFALNDLVNVVSTFFIIHQVRWCYLRVFKWSFETNIVEKNAVWKL